MNTKTMEGLVGARTSMNLLNTPFRVYKEARRKGDTETMERAMGYVNDYSDQADEYKEEADVGMKEDAKAARERQKLELEKAIQKRKEEQAELKQRTEESKNGEDTVEISEDGKVLLKESPAADADALDGNGSLSATVDTTPSNKEPVTYTKTGEVQSSEQTVGTSVSVSV